MLSRKLLAVTASLVLSIVFPAISAAQAPAQPMQAVPHKLLPILSQLHQVGPTDPNTVIHLAVSLQPAGPDAFQEFCDSVSDPKSPNYRHFITPQKVGERFGAASEDVDAVVTYLKQHGMTITLVNPNRMAISVDATAAQAARAFQTSFSDFEANNPVGSGTISFHANTKPAMLPQSIAEVVIDIEGLENYTRPMPLANTTLLTPPLTRALYDTKPMYDAGNTGSGRVVAVSNWDGFRIGTSTSGNVYSYYTHFGLPTPPGGITSNITVVTIDGGSGGGSAGGEGDLDIQMELGMAPLATQRIYDGGSSLINVLSREVSDNLADCISESYGWSLDAATATSAHNQHLSMTAQGITYMAASGDSGTTLTPYSYPDYEPEALQVGGTVANVNNSTGARVSETGWSGSGGGWVVNTLSFNKLPSWQVGTGVPTTHNYRLVPDVALHSAGSGTGAYQFYYNGGLNGGSIGTSFASPVFCGSLAVSEQKLISLGGLPPDANGKRRFGRIMNVFYAQNGRTDVWYDITSGGNGKLPDGTTSSCTTKWDFVTGWGAIDFNAFVTTQIPGGTPTTLTESNISGAIGQTVTQSATLTKTSDGTPIANEPINFVVNSTNSGSGTSNSSGVATATYTIPESVGTGSVPISAIFSGDSTYQSSTATATLTVSKADTALSVPAKSGSLGQTITLNATLTRTTDNAALALKTVSFTVDGLSAGSTNTSSSGVASLSYIVPDTLTGGTHTIQVTFAGTPLYNASTGSGTLNVTKGDTTTTANPNSGVYGQTIALTASLIRNVDSVVIVGRTIDFSVGGTYVGSGTTNGSGTATYNYVISDTLPVGSNTILASFAGDGVYNASSGTNTLTVSKANTSLAVGSASGNQGGTASLTATLKRTSDNGLLSGKTVTFAVDGGAAGSGVTDGSGVATVTYSIPSGMSVGSHTIGASFAGDTKYNSSSGTGTLTVNQGASATVSGVVDLQNIADPTGQSSTIEFRTPGTTNVLYSTTITLDGSGNYTATGVPYGTYDIAVKFSNWLRQVLPSVSIAAPAVGGQDFSLVNGDANPDNKVDLLDLSTVLSNFGASGSTPLDGDVTWNGLVDLLDLSTVLSNFGATGAP